ncbi:hypothetical protein [Nocardia carnea]|uniref:hypothetical protein n=1 Tax=Nocardia carnea TaxID=37328 RepID=UPI002458C933|nr:hypothetical protein [Nocardia carnea]
MVEFRDVAALGFDLGVTFFASKATNNMPWFKQGAADVLSGYVGGVGADMIANGPGLDSFGAPGMAGAGGALLGTAAGQLARTGLRAGGRSADDALTQAQNVHSTAADQARRLENAENAVTGAEDKLRDANRNFQRLDDEFQDAQRRFDAAEARLNGMDPRDPGYAAAQRSFDNAEQALTAATNARRAARQTLDDAEDAVQTARRDLTDARNAHGGLQSAADDAEKAMKAAERRKNMWGTDGHAVKWVKPTLVAIGSGAFVAGGVIDWGSGTNPAGAGSVDLMWDGYAPAASEGLAGQAPFAESQVNPGVRVVGGRGFLLRPEDSLLNPQLISAYGGATGSFAATVVDVYQMSGDLEKKIELRLDPAPRMPQGITVGSSSGGTSYEQVTAKVESALDDLYKSELSNKDTAAKVEEISATVKESVGFLINGVNTQVQQLTASPELEINFMSIVSQGFDELIGILENAANAMDRAASGIEDPSAGDEEASQELGDRVGALEDSLNDRSLWPDGSEIGTPDPTQQEGLGVGTPEVPGTASADLADAAKEMEDRANEALQASTPSTPAGSLGSIPDPSAAANGMMGNSLLSSLLPTLLSQAAMRNGADSDLARRIDDIDPSRYDAAAAPTMPAARPAATTPWSTPPATTPAPAQPAQHQSGPPPGATSNQPGAGLPKRVPGADGLVVYPFPDGRTQKVPLTVALGLDKAFANKTGTDAQAAYAGTPAAWTDPKDIGPAVDPFQLATGDVVTWLVAAKDEGRVPAGASAVVGTPAGGPSAGEQTPPEGEKETGDQPAAGGSPGKPESRSALLVVFGEGESGTVEAIVHGELQQYAPDMTDPDGRAFGEFAGFKHPKGIEAAGDTGQDGDAAATTGTDQPVADMPALAAPA